MKNYKKVFVIFAFIFVAFATETFGQQPTCSYSINSAFANAVSATIVYFEDVGTCVACDSQTITINPGANVYTCAGTCGAICDVQITINTTTVTILNFNTPVTGTAPGGACSSGNMQLIWSYSQLDLNCN